MAIAFGNRPDLELVRLPGPGMDVDPARLFKKLDHLADVVFAITRVACYCSDGWPTFAILVRSDGQLHEDVPGRCRQSACSDSLHFI